MLGAEAVAVLGVISSIVSIVTGAKQVFDAATDAQGLPKAFREVAGRLPIVQSILDSIRQHVGRGDFDEEACKGLKNVVEACEEKTKKLGDLFHKASSTSKESGLKRYYRAVRVYGRGNEVESLMKGILEDIQLLAFEHGTTETKDLEGQVVQAIQDMSTLPPSVPEHLFDETGFIITNSGSGTQNNIQGKQYNGPVYKSAGGSMSFGRD